MEEKLQREYAIATCYLCQKDILPSQSYQTADSFSVGALKGNKYPPVGSPNYDLRSGVLVHVSCFNRHIEKKSKKAAKKEIQ